MFDINFFQKFYAFKRALSNGLNANWGFILESYRNSIPVIFNIETTSYCDQKCSFCPRTTRMTRKPQTMSVEIFDRIVPQISPWPSNDWDSWKRFCEAHFAIGEFDEPSENHFFLYVVPKVITLHGYGNPIIDTWMPYRIEQLSDKKIPTYFSYSPSNIEKPDKLLNICRSGLSYLKFSVDSTVKKMRGESKDFIEYGPKILNFIELLRKNNINTQIVVTMIDFDSPDQDDEWQLLLEYFEGTNCYIYKKSQDQTYLGGKDMTRNRAIHWNFPCVYPWSSMTIASSGKVIACAEDYNESLVLGDVMKESLVNIWNGEKYREFRQSHLSDTNSYCRKNCGMKLIGQV